MAMKRAIHEYNYRILLADDRVAYNVHKLFEQRAGPEGVVSSEPNGPLKYIISHPDSSVHSIVIPQYEKRCVMINIVTSPTHIGTLVEPLAPYSPERLTNRKL